MSFTDIICNGLGIKYVPTEFVENVENWSRLEASVQ